MQYVHKQVHNYENQIMKIRVVVSRIRKRLKTLKMMCTRNLQPSNPRYLIEHQTHSHKTNKAKLECPLGPVKYSIPPELLTLFQLSN